MNGYCNVSIPALSLFGLLPAKANVLLQNKERAKDFRVLLSACLSLIPFTYRLSNLYFFQVIKVTR